jgi:hypothetical protein
MKIMTYEAWKLQVNRHVVEQTGLDADDLPDYRFRDDYEDGVKPAVTARRVVKAAKKDMGL